MSRLMRTSEVTKLPVVVLAGDDIAQVKDVIFSADGGAVVGLSLAGRGVFAGPKKDALAWSAVGALGADAVMIRDQDALAPLKEVIASAASSAGAGRHRGNVLGSQVLTDAGMDLGKVVDVVIEFEAGERTVTGTCDVIGYEIEASESLRASRRKSQGTRLLVPLPDTLAVSGEHLVVPASAEQFVGEDLAGFGAAVEEFRAQLGARGGVA